MFKFIKYLIASAIVITAGAGSYVFWPMTHTPTPANFECLPMDNKNGKLVPLHLDNKNIYGVALTYPGIIYQSGSEYHPAVRPPVFRKLQQSMNTGNVVKYPNLITLLNRIEAIEPNLHDVLQDRFEILPAMVDYEVELGIVVLDAISLKQLSDPTFSPKLGYFLANDMQSITFGVLGLGTEYESEYFDAKGSFTGFLPVSKYMWIPVTERTNSTLCIDIKTTVNGELRQRANTKNRIYLNQEILRFVLGKYNRKTLTKGTAVITGSPSGSANRTPRWKRRLANLLNMNRLDKLSSMFNAVSSDNKFLKPGDVVVVEGEPFGSIRTEITK